MKKNLLFFGVFVILVASFLSFKKGNENAPVVVKNDISTTTTTHIIGMVNPASANCEKVGGKLVINKRGDGGEYGLCYFEENRACE